MTEAQLPTDPALSAAVLELDAYAQGEGWGRQARLFALVDTATFAEQEPALAEMLGLDADDSESLTPVEQDVAPGKQLEQVLEEIGWPASVTGCAVVVERFVLPPGVDVPEDQQAAEKFAASHPDRQEVRIVAGVTRAGAAYSAMRLRADDDPTKAVVSTDLVPGLIAALQATLEEDEA